MFLCCVETLSRFQSKLDFLQNFKVAPKSGQISSIITQREFSIFIIFFMHIHVHMLCRSFEWILIKIGFFTNFLSCSKIMPKTLYYSTAYFAKFYQKSLRENSPFLLHFLMHIHVLMLCRNFQLIQNWIFYEYLKLPKVIMLL